MSEYDPVESLRTEVDRFFKTNQFNPLQVTNFYVQAKIVLSLLDAERKAAKQNISYQKLYYETDLELRKVLAENDDREAKLRSAK